MAGQEKGEFCPMRSYKFILGLAFFISGTSAILYEIGWIRLLSLAFGGVTLITGLITALFLAGLALGAFFGGKAVDRLAGGGMRKILVFYLFVELLIALLGIINWRAFSYFSQTPGNWRYLIAYLLIIGQAIIIGSTWPLMFKIFLRVGSQWRVAGLVTFLNTLGGAFGALFGSFFLLANIGMTGTLAAAAGGNALAGLAVGFWGLKGKNKEMVVRLGKVRPADGSFSPFLIILALFWAGFLGMALEIFWMRSFGLVLGSSIYSFTLVLFAILLGLALGGLVVSKWDERISQNNFVWLFYLSSLLVFLGLVFLPKTPGIIVWWLEKFGKTFVSFEALGVLLVSSVVLLPSLISGVIFAKGVVLLRVSFDLAGGKAGLAYFANTLGAVLGGVSAALFLLVWLGLKEGMAILAGSGILIYLVLLIFSGKLHKSFLIWFLISAAVASYGLVNWDNRVMSSGAWLYGPSVLKKTAGVKLLSYQDGRESTVSVVWQEGVKSILINGKADASSEWDMGTQAILGHVPILLSQKPKNVLVIGLGSGITAGAISRHAKVEKITVAEIEPAVVEAAGKYFQEENYDVLKNPKLRLFIGDGRNFLLKTSEQFEVITSEPSNPWIAGQASLFTREFFELGRNRLSGDGVFFQWLHLYNLRPSEVKSIIKTFHSVFPYVQLWTSSNPVDIFLAGKKEPFNLSWDRFQEALANPGVRESLKRRGFDDEIRLFSLLWARTEMVDKLAEGGELHTDRRPILESRAPLGLFENTLSSNLDILLPSFQVGGNIFDIEGMPDEAVEKMKKAREARFDLVRARQKMENGSFDEAISLAEEGMKKDNQAPRLKRLLAQLYLGKAKTAGLEESINFYQKALELSENYYDAYLGLLQIYISQSLFTEAKNLIKTGREKFPWSGQILMYEGIVAGAEADLEKAEELLLESRRFEPWSALVRNNLAHLYTLQERRDLAVKEWQESLALDPNQPNVKERLRINLLKIR